MPYVVAAFALGVAAGVGLVFWMSRRIIRAVSQDVRFWIAASNFAFTMSAALVEKTGAVRLIGYRLAYVGKDAHDRALDLGYQPPDPSVTAAQ